MRESRRGGLARRANRPGLARFGGWERDCSGRRVQIATVCPVTIALRSRRIVSSRLQRGSPTQKRGIALFLNLVLPSKVN
ncbi:hypothetical protein Taro_047757 [Colocasia esculenta]|uniref:Uncharacterized protein n=1 Tax=Colocasia esculenta TaxID=4460 RepID=A0A843X5S4_COLES|nr:hypothetical protein [Colocasia esculenta]